MKFLVDANLPPDLCVWLRGRGHDAEHLTDLNLLTATDTELWDRGRVQRLKMSTFTTAPWRVTAVTSLPNFRLSVIFVDGTAGEIDMRAFLNNPNVDSTIFEPLRNPAVFSQAQVKLGVIQWPNGADLAPDANVRRHS